MGSDELRAAIEAEGDARVAAILRTADEEATRLLREAEARAEQRRRDELCDLEAELQREADARIASARAEARHLVLDARDHLIRRVFDGAADALACEVDEPAAKDELIARAERAFDHLPPDDPIAFVCSSAVAPLLEAALAIREGVRVERDPDLPSGFRATGANGAVVIDATFPSLLDMDRPRLAIEILRRLDAETGKGA